MRLALVRNVGLSMLALGVFAVAGCNNNPIDYDKTTTVALQLVPSTMVISAGRSEQIQVTPMNQGMEPTGTADVSFSIISCGVGGASILIEADVEQQLPVLPPMSRWRVEATNTIGQACVVWASQGIQDTLLVTVVPEGLRIVSAPQVLRSGESSTISLELIDAEDGIIAPIDNTTAEWSSDDAGILPVDAAGNVGPAVLTGTAVITATWTGTEETATAGLGVSRSIDIPIPVIAEVPDTARFNPDVLTGDSFGTVKPGALISSTVEALDQYGNVNDLAAEVTAVALTSSNPAAATVTVERVVDPDNPEIITMPYLVSAVAPGQATISGTVTTTNGTFPVSATIDVVEPLIAGLSADNGDAGDIITISGTGFIAAGFTTTVTVGGQVLGNFTVDSDTQITAQMPSYATAGARTVLVDVGGVESNGLSWSQNDAYDEPATENNDPSAGGTAAPLSIPSDIKGVLLTTEPITSIGQNADYFEFTLSAETDLDFLVDFDSSDVDVVVNAQGTTGYGGECGFAGATGAHPEHFECTLAAGTYWVLLQNYDGLDANWDLIITVIE